MIIRTIVRGQRPPTGCPFEPGGFSREYLAAFALAQGKIYGLGVETQGFYRFYHPSQFFWDFLQIKRDRPFGFEGAHHVGPHFFQYIAPLLVNLPLTWFRLKLGDISKWYFLESDTTPLDVG